MSTPSTDGRGRIRRSLIALLLALLLLVVLVVALGSGGRPGPSPQVSASPAAGGAPEPTPAAGTAGGVTPTGVPADAQQTVVVAIVDGDTLDTDLGRVRIHGIDTPERGAALSEEATSFLTAAVPVGATIWLSRAPSSDDTDIYGRLVRTVLTAAGTDVGRSLVRAGLARAYLKYSERYLPDQDRAQQAGAGIWAGATSPDAATEGPTSAAGGGADGQVGTTDGTAAGAVGSEPWNLPGPDLDCADIGHVVQVLPPDYHRLDRDGDGWACESYR